jgi:hypothetical protein
MFCARNQAGDFRVRSYQCVVVPKDSGKCLSFEFDAVRFLLKLTAT